MTAFFKRSESEKKFIGPSNEEGINGVDSNRLKTVLFFGNSLTAGYALSPAQSFPSLIQGKIAAEKLSYQVINAGISGETSAGGNYRINSVLKDEVDVFVLELGVNDGLRGIPVAETRKNLQSIIDKVKAKYPDAKLVLAGMQVPPWLNPKFAEDFRIMFPDLAKKNQMAHIPFLLQGVAGVRALNLPDGAHPNAEGQKIVAKNVWVILKDVLK